jgi:hypothetical protein
MPMTAQNAYAQAAVTVSDAQISALASACAGGAASSACKTALQNLVATLKGATGATTALVIGTIVARVAQVSNAAIANPGVTTLNAAAAAQAVTALSALASSEGLTSLATTIAAVGSNVANGVTVDLTAVASGSGNAIPSNPASQT